MACRAFESAERRLQPAQRAMTYRDASLVIVETLKPGDFAHPTYNVCTREDADGQAARSLKRGWSVLIHHREGTVTMSADPRVVAEGGVA